MWPIVDADVIANVHEYVHGCENVRVLYRSLVHVYERYFVIARHVVGYDAV